MGIKQIDKRKIILAGGIFILLFSVICTLFYISENIMMEYVYHVGISKVFSYGFLIIAIILLVIPYEYLIAVFRDTIRLFNISDNKAKGEVILFFIIELAGTSIIQIIWKHYSINIDLFLPLYMITILTCIRFQTIIKNYWISLAVQLIIAANNIYLPASMKGYVFTGILLYGLVVIFIGIYSINVYNENKNYGKFVLVIGLTLVIVSFAWRYIEVARVGNDNVYNYIIPFLFIKNWLGRFGFGLYILSLALFFVSGIYACIVLKRHSVKRFGVLSAFIMIMAAYFASTSLLETGIEPNGRSLFYPFCIIPILIRIFIIKPIPKPEKDEGDIIDIIIGDGQAEKDIYDEIYTEIDILDDLVSELTERQSILFKYIIVLENKVNELERKNSGGLSKEEQEEFDAFKERIKDFPQKSQDVWDRWNEIKERRMNAKDEEGQTK